MTAAERLSRLLALLALPLAAALCGCESGHADVASVLTPDRPASLPSVTPAIAWTLKPPAATFVVVEGKNAGAKVIIERAENPAAKGGWIERRRFESEPEPFLEDIFTMTSDGDAALVESLNRTEGVISTFDPPMIVMTSRLKPGETHKQSLTLVVHPIDDRNAVRDQGPATHEISYIGDADLQGVGASPIGAAHVRGVFKAKLAAASVVNTTDMWHPLPAGAAADRFSLLAQHDEETATFLGIKVRDVVTVLHLASP